LTTGLTTPSVRPTFGDNFLKLEIIRELSVRHQFLRIRYFQFEVIYGFFEF